MPRLVYAALIMLSLIWGGSFYFIKVLLGDFGPWSIAFLRSSSGLVAITIIMLVLRKPFALRSIRWAGMAIMATVNTALPWALIGFSETKLTSGMASILNATTPIWTLIVGLLFFRGRSSRGQWAGIGLAFMGVVVLLGITPASMGSVNMIGFVLMLLATWCYAFGSQLSKRLLGGTSMYQMTFGTLLVAATVSGVMAFATAEPISYSTVTTPHNLPMIIGLGVFGSGIGYILFYFMVQKGSPEFASMVTYLVPGTALIWGYALLDEKITWNLIAGLCIILCGVYVAGRKPKAER